MGESDGKCLWTEQETCIAFTSSVIALSRKLKGAPLSGSLKRSFLIDSKSPHNTHSGRPIGALTIHRHRRQHLDLHLLRPGQFVRFATRPIVSATRTHRRHWQRNRAPLSIRGSGCCCWSRFAIWPLACTIAHWPAAPGRVAMGAAPTLMDGREWQQAGNILRKLPNNSSSSSMCIISVESTLAQRPSLEVCLLRLVGRC